MEWVFLKKKKKESLLNSFVQKRQWKLISQVPVSDFIIDKAIIQSSGEKIWFKKNKQQGITFYFSLPIAKT